MKRNRTVLMLVIGIMLTVLSFFVKSNMSDFPESLQNITEVLWLLMLTVGIVLVTISVILLFDITKKLKRQELLPKGATYLKKNSVMTRPELQLYWLLLKIIDRRRFTVIPQPSLASVIEKRTGGGYYSELFRMSDFLIADSCTFEPLLLIELNDLSHKRADRAERDEKVAAICENAGMPLLTIDFKDKDDINYLKNKLKKYI